MRGRVRSPGLLAAVVLAGAARAMAADPDPGAPSVCVPPCGSSEICVGQTCVAPDRRPAPRARPAPPPVDPTPSAPPGSAPTTGPQPSGPGVSPLAQPPPQPTFAPPPPAYLPPGYPGAPVPGGYYYAPPPGYAYPPPVVYAPVPRAPRTKRGFLALPQLGVHSLQNQAAASYDPGLRIGTILGGRFSDRFSLNADLAFDVSNVHDLAPGDSFREWTFTLAICPLFLLPVGPLEILTGPKTGYYFVRGEQQVMNFSQQLRGTGLELGLDAGVFLPVSPKTSLGVLFSFELRMPMQACQRTGGVEICDNQSRNADAIKVLGASAAAVF